jgi:hypothetical protein
MPPLFTCDQCRAEHVFVGALPDACPSCGALTIWRTRVAWVLNLNDRRLLQSLRIASD